MIEWNRKVNDERGFFPTEISFGSDKLVAWLCIIPDTCGCHKRDATVQSRTTQGKGCPFCYGRVACIHTCLATTHPDLVIRWLMELNHPITPYNISRGSSKSVWWPCLRDTNHPNWLVSVNDRTGHESGCPSCCIRKGPDKINTFLATQQGIVYGIEKRFDNCRSIRPLSFDFWIIIGDRLFLIEFDGIQHFQAVRFGGMSQEDAEISFKANQARDVIKTKYCRDNYISLLRIPYTELDLVETYVTMFLQDPGSKISYAGDPALYTHLIQEVHKIRFPFLLPPSETATSKVPMQVPGGLPYVQPDNIQLHRIFASTLRGSTAWFVTTIISMILSIAFCIGYVYLVGQPAWVWLALSYFCLLITASVLSMITRDKAREANQPLVDRPPIVILTMRLVASVIFFVISVVMFLVALLVPDLDALEKLCGAGFSVLLVMSVFLFTKTLQDRREATYYQN
jgi:hypothetical protein